MESRAIFARARGTVVGAGGWGERPARKSEESTQRGAPSFVIFRTQAHGSDRIPRRLFILIGKCACVYEYVSNTLTFTPGMTRRRHRAPPATADCAQVRAGTVKYRLLHQCTRCAAHLPRLPSRARTPSGAG